jgi:hypothetical protein
MEQFTSWEAKSHSASEEIACFFMEPGSVLTYSQESITSFYPVPNKSSPQASAIFL